MIMKILMSLAILFAILGNFDFITYALKSTPKIAIFPRWIWYLGFICDAYLIYHYVLN